MKTSHIMSTSNILTGLYFTKQKNKNKKYFFYCCLQCFSSKNVLTKHKDVCLRINGAQLLGLEKRIIEFKNYFKQMPVPWKLYADFECNLKSVESYENSYSESINTTFLAVLVTNMFVLMMNLSNRFLLLEVNSLKQFLKSIIIVKSDEKHFNKNLILSEEEEFQSSNTYWVCEKLINNDYEKVKGLCHIPGKFRGADHWSCNINIQLTKKVPVIFHNLRGNDSDLIFCELNKFDLKIELIPNRLEKYMPFFIKQNLSLYWQYAVYEF